MANFNTDYLRYDSNDIKRLITQKLAENPLFTDFIFEDSNLTTLIDIFAHTFQTLLYYTNKSASESYFSDAVIYENINRIVKILSYNPLGYISSQTECIFATIGQEATDPESERLVNITQAILPKYTFVNTNLSDKSGSPIYYSMINNRFITPDSDGILDSSNSVDKTLFVNGRWTLYDSTFIANGVAFEQITLINLDLADERYIAHTHIDVYVKRAGINSDTYELFTPISEGTLFNSNSTLLTSEDNVFELRINENKRYTLTFGDGLHGSRLNVGDEIYIIYLEGNGPSGEIGTDFFNNNNALDYSIAGMSEQLFNDIIDIDKDSLVSKDNLAKMYIRNLVASTTFSDIESVDEIRANAPSSFRTGERLITRKDYEQYIKANYKADVSFIRAMNNYEYMSKFLDWLKKYNLLTIDVRESQYVYADSCDFNNVYLWIKYNASPIDPTIIEEALAPRKVLTSEPIVLSALKVNIVPALKNNNYDLTGDTGWDPCIENWIEITKHSNSLVSADKIKSNAIKVFNHYFNPDRFAIGSTVDLRELQQLLLGIDGVDRVRTAYLSKANQASERCDLTEYFNGLSFAQWTPSVINGADISLFTGNMKVLDFQYPEIIDDTQLQLSKRIKVVFDAYGTKSIEY